MNEESTPSREETREIPLSSDADSQACEATAADHGAVPDLDVFGRPAPNGRDWSHRRGEPRVFAFFWTVYLLVATIAAFWSVGAPGSNEPLALRPAARTILATISVGITLLWPMIRLSQEVPSRRVRRVSGLIWQDFMILLIPSQAILWPQIALASWPVSVVAALACSLTAWSIFLGALLTVAIVLTQERRSWWMLAFVACAGFGPLVAFGPGGTLLKGDDSFDWWWMTSPITTGFEIARDRPWTGAAAAVTESHWWAIAVVGVLGVVAWCFVAVWGLFQRGEPA